MPNRRTLDFVYFDAGGGHRSAALALQSVIADSDYDWRVRLVNLQDVLDSLDVFRQLSGVRLQDIYNLVLAKGWTLGSRYLLPCMHGVIRLYHAGQVKLLSEFWQGQRPDMVVSLVPNFNRALFQSLARTLPGVPFVTILTDLADYPPHFWMERQRFQMERQRFQMEGQRQYLICGTDRAIAQAKAKGYCDGQVFQTSGMILRPEFYSLPALDRGDERKNLGLDPALPTGLVLFGSEGSNAMFPIAQDLGNSTSDLQLILICGRNHSLEERLKRLKTRNRMLIRGFTKEIPRHMYLADFFVGKPGPGSISEALQMGLPVIVERNAWTLPQERYNTEWVAEQGFGVVLRNFRGIDQTVRELLASGKLIEMKKRAAAIQNRAVFEIPAILERIFNELAHNGLAGGGQIR